jgi:hypothetical protein
MDVPSRTRFAGLIAAAVLVAGCASSAATASPAPSASPAASASPGATDAPVASPGVAATDGLVALVDEGGPGLWTLASAGWSKIAAVQPKAVIAASGDGIVLVSPSTVELRSWPDLGTPGSARPLEWQPGATPNVESVAVSPAGDLALAVSANSRIGYGTVSASGRVSALDVPDAQPFTPLVAWADATRRIVLATDARQVSQLAVLAGPGSYQLIAGLEGCRWFGLSGDGRTIVVATDAAVYVGPTEAVLAGTMPAQIAPIASGAVAWDLVLDRAGARLAYLVGDVAADGTVSGARAGCGRKPSRSMHRRERSSGRPGPTDREEAASSPSRLLCATIRSAPGG